MKNMSTGSGQEQRQDEEDADRKCQREADHEYHGASGNLCIRIATSVHVRGKEHHTHAQDQHLPEDEKPADERQARPSAAIDGSRQLLGVGKNLPVGLADTDRRLMTAAHHHALDHGLPAVVEVGHWEYRTGNAREGPVYLVPR